MLHSIKIKPFWFPLSVFFLKKKYVKRNSIAFKCHDIPILFGVTFHIDMLERFKGTHARFSCVFVARCCCYLVVTINTLSLLIAL